MLTKLFGAWLALAFVLVAPAIAADPPPIFVAGQFIREHAVDDGRGHLLVPVRGVFEALHAGVTYTPPRYVVVRKNGAVIAGLMVDRNHAVVGHRPRNLAVAPIRRNGRVYVPLRIIAEIAGATVMYAAKPRLVDIRLPYNELGAAVATGDLRSQAPSDPAVPAWAYAIVGIFVLGFVIEVIRRVATAVPRRTPKRSPPSDLVPLGIRPLQFPYPVRSGDEHGIGQMRK